MLLVPRLRPFGLALLLGLLTTACSPLPKEYYCYYVPQQGLWGERMCILYPLLVTHSERQHHVELLLRLDSRMRQSDHRLRYTASERSWSSGRVVPGWSALS